LEMCSLLVDPSSPAHSESSPVCLYERLHAWVTSGGSSVYNSFPIPEHIFPAVLREFLQNPIHHYMHGMVGFRSQEGQRHRLAWFQVRMHSRFLNDVSVVSNPKLLQRFIDQWTLWFDGFSSAVSTSRPQNETSVLRHGFPTCSSWPMLATLNNFLSGILRSIILTPVFCLFALSFFVGDVTTCYCALYTVLAMIFCIMGCLKLLNVPLGPIESLSLSVVIGVSVDYLVHLAFAYTNSLMPERYYKSRGAFLARCTSIVSASITTLCAVVPLLFAQMLPLRQFGIIFSLVAALSLVFSLGFFATLMMMVGPGEQLARPPPKKRLSGRLRASSSSHLTMDIATRAPCTLTAHREERRPSRAVSSVDAVLLEV